MKKLLSQAQLRGRLEFAESEEQPALFIKLEALSSLVYRILDSWDHQVETLAWRPSAPATFGDVAAFLQKEEVFTGLEVHFRGQEQELYQDLGGPQLTERYQWSEPAAILDLPVVAGLQTAEQMALPLKATSSPWMDGLVLLVGAFVAQGLQLLVAQQSFALSLSFPLLYLVLVAQARGIKKGFLALGLVVFLQLLLAQGQAMSLLSSAAFWIQLLAYVLATALAGYLQIICHQLHFGA